MLKRGLLVVIVLLAVAAASVAIAYAQDAQPPTPTYVGSDKCLMCHRSIYDNWAASPHAKMIQDPAQDPQVILADFAKISSVITDSKLQYAQKDIVLTLGSRYIQRYIIADRETGRLVMGAGQWNIAGQGTAAVESAWQTAAAGDDWLKECAGCHTTGFDLAQSTKFTAADYSADKATPFVELGVGCEACHGPASEHIKAPNKDTIPVPKSQALDAQICGQCHARGVSKDGQGQTHPYPLGYTPGGDLSKANWTPIQPTGLVTDVNWWTDGHAKNDRQQYQEWFISKHATALDTLKAVEGQDSCATCHSADALLAAKDNKPIKLAEAQFEITCQACHDPHKESTPPSDPSLRDESYQECTTCHNATADGARPIKAGTEPHHPVQEMYEGTGAIGVDDKPSPHFAAQDGKPVCVSCHMPGTATSTDAGDIPTHDWRIVMPGKVDKGEPNACSACHTNPDSKIMQLDAAALQKIIDDRQKDTAIKLTALEARLKALSDKNTAWMDVPTQAPAGAAPDSFKAAFTDLSFIKSDGSEGFHNYQYTQAILNKVDTDLKDLEQPPATPTTAPQPATPTLMPPTDTPAPIVAAAPQASPETNWLVWLSLSSIVVVVLAVLIVRKPKAS